MPDETALVAQFNRELKALAERQERISLEIHPIDAWILLSMIQLALRHPQNTEESAARAEHLARRLQSLIADTGALAVVAERGWDASYDRPGAMAPAQPAEDWLWQELGRRLGQAEADELRQLYERVREGGGP